MVGLGAGGGVPPMMLLLSVMFATTATAASVVVPAQSELLLLFLVTFVIPNASIVRKCPRPVNWGSPPPPSADAVAPDIVLSSRAEKNASFLHSFSVLAKAIVLSSVSSSPAAAVAASTGVLVVRAPQSPTHPTAVSIAATRKKGGGSPPELVHNVATPPSPLAFFDLRIPMRASPTSNSVRGGRSPQLIRPPSS